MSALTIALADAGGPAAPRERGAQLLDLLGRELERGARELGRQRSGRDEPVLVAIAGVRGALLAATPAPAALRIDSDAGSERALLLVAAAIGALYEATGGPPPHAAADLSLSAGELLEHLVLRVPAADTESDGDAELAELAALAFEEHVAPVARLRARAVVLPAHVLQAAVADVRAPRASALRSAEAVARLGGRPADPASVAEHEDAVLDLLVESGGVARPHEDPDPARRVARRILQRLHGMGKWGGYHTDFAHLARGFAGNDRALADAVGEALLEAGLLAEKPSVGQRHVFLDPRRAPAIHALIERGELPSDLRLPSS